MIVIDRLEGDIAVLEIQGQTWQIPRAVLPHGAQEGDVLELVKGSNAALKARAQDRQDRLSAQSKVPDEIDL
jgi:hypothetical protein